MTTAASTPAFDFDIAIVGAGPVGLALAGWLARRSATRALSVALVDARDPDASENDPRAIAVSQGSRMLLDTLGWPGDATPIEHIHVSQRGHFGRTLIERDEHDLAALGYVARYGSIVRALARGARHARALAHVDVRPFAGAGRRRRDHRARHAAGRAHAARACSSTRRAASSTSASAS